MYGLVHNPHGVILSVTPKMSYCSACHGQCLNFVRRRRHYKSSRLGMDNKRPERKELRYFPRSVPRNLKSGCHSRVIRNAHIKSYKSFTNTLSVDILYDLYFVIGPKLISKRSFAETVYYMPYVMTRHFKLTLYCKILGN
jgi:ribosomal protein L44E